MTAPAPPPAPPPAPLPRPCLLWCTRDGRWWTRAENGGHGGLTERLDEAGRWDRAAAEALIRWHGAARRLVPVPAPDGGPDDNP